MLRRSRIGLALFAPLALAAPVMAEEPLPAWLERLASESAHERELAQRWLAAHLATSDFAEVARAAERGDAEVRRRLGEALAAEDRHLGLAVLLASERAGELADLGRRAFEQLVLRWCPGADEPPARYDAVIERLAESDAGRFAVEAADEPPGRALDRLGRLSDLAAPLVVGPALADQPAQRIERLEGTATQLLDALGRLERCAYAGVGDWRGPELGPGAWVLVSTPAEVERETAVQWLLAWCRSVQAARGPAAEAAAAARALAATAWPAGLAWLEERWLARRDVNALSGLLLAAERGRVAPGLTAPGERRRLLEYADQALATVDGARAAERAARALAAAGAASPGGEDPSLELAEGFEALGPSSRWVRLVALEGVRSADPRGLALVERVALDPDGIPPALRMQALRTLAAAPRGSVAPRPPARLAELVEEALASGREGELAGLLVALGGSPLAALEAAGLRDPRSPGSRRTFVLEVAYRAGDPAAAVILRELLAAAARDAAWRDALAERLASWVRRDGAPGPARLVERAAAELGPGAREAADRIAARAGCLAPERQVTLVETLGGAAELGADELELLGALAAGPRGRAARGMLLGQLAAEGRARDEALVRALGRAAAELRRALADEEHAELLRAVWAAVARPDHPLHERLRPPLWPPPVVPEAIPLALLDRRLPRAP